MYVKKGILALYLQLEPASQLLGHMLTISHRFTFAKSRYILRMFHDWHYIEFLIPKSKNFLRQMQPEFRSLEVPKSHDILSYKSGLIIRILGYQP